jgi:hypothetical protein
MRKNKVVANSLDGHCEVAKGDRGNPINKRDCFANARNDKPEAEDLEKRCHDCGGNLPRGKGRVSFYCRLIGLCRYCYRHKFPKRGRPKWPPISSGSERLLSWDERRYMERAGFNPEVWSPEFRREMEDYWRARMRGEC